MPENEPPPQEIDRRLKGFAGSRRARLRRWAQLPLERLIAALKEMQGCRTCSRNHRWRKVRAANHAPNPMRGPGAQASSTGTMRGVNSLSVAARTGSNRPQAQLVSRQQWYNKRARGTTN